jgi:hypothetical protein
MKHVYPDICSEIDFDQYLTCAPACCQTYCLPYLGILSSMCPEVCSARYVGNFLTCSAAISWVSFLTGAYMQYNDVKCWLILFFDLLSCVLVECGWCPPAPSQNANPKSIETMAWYRGFAEDHKPHKHREALAQMTKPTQSLQYSCD